MKWKHRAGALLLALVMALSLTLPAAAAEGGAGDSGAGDSETPGLPATVPVDGVSLNRTSVTLEVNDTETLTATVSPENASDKTVTWRSSDTSVATVDQRGTVTALTVGTAVITAEANNGVKATCVVSVRISNLSATLTSEKTSVEQDEEVTVRLELNDPSKRITNVTWYPGGTLISNTQISDYTCTATFRSSSISAGTEVYAVVSVDGGSVISNTIRITVTKKPEAPPEEKPATSISMLGNASYLYINRSQSGTLTALTTPEDSTDPVTWELRSGEGIVRLTPNPNNDRQCTVVGLAPGAATVVAKVEGELGTFETAPFLVEVNGITLDKTTLEIFENGDPGTLTASCFGVARSMSLTWKSQSEAIVSVRAGSAAGGIGASVYGNSVGTANVTVSAGTNGNYTADCAVTVKENVAGLIEAGSVAGGASFSFNSTSLFSALRSRCTEMTDETLLRIRGLEVNPSQGILYYKYTSPEFPGQGVGSDPYYLSPSGTTQRGLADVTFVPATGYVGNADITYTGESSGGKNFSGTIRVNVTSTGDVTYSTASNLPVTFEAADFTAICRAKQGQEIKYISFQTPTSGKGTLYRTYSAAAVYNVPVTATDRFYRTSNPLLDEVTFVPAENTTGTVRIPYTCVTTSNGSYTGTVTVYVEDRNAATSQGAVNYTVAPGGTVNLRSSDFNSACRDATGSMLNYVRFTGLPASSQGTLYINYRNASDTGTRVSENTSYFRTGTPQISDITFAAASGFTGSVSVPFTAYATGGESFSGTMVIRVSESSAGTVRYSVPAGGAVTFSEQDFNDAFRSMTGNTLEYVTFSLPSSSRGTLYRNYRGSGSTGSSVSSSTKFYYRSSNYSISDVTFAAKSGYSGTVSFTYRGYDGNGDRTDGTVEITVGGTGSSTIAYTGSTQPIAMRLSDFQSACRNLTGGTLSYIQFTSLPSTGAGQLRMNYVSTSNVGASVSTNTSYYASGTPSISQLSFVPGTGYQGLASVSYTGWDTQGRSFNGTVQITLSGGGYTPSSSFMDLGGYSAEFVTAIEYLHNAGVVNGYSSGMFGPSRPVTRGEFALMLCRAFNLNTGRTVSFPDVPSNSVYAWAVATARDYGITQGNNGMYLPYSSITRQEAMTMIHRAMTAMNWNVPVVPVSTLSAYRDYTQVSGYARAALASLIRMGAVQGDASGNLNPTQNITRAQMAVILYRVLTQV